MSKFGKILVVDDEPDIIDYVVFLLETNGFTDIRTAGSGNDAIEVVKAERIDLVISDVRMPNGSGVDLANFVLNIQPPELRPDVILVTGFSDECDDVIEHPEVLCQLGKPLNIQKFEDTLAEWAAQRRGSPQRTG